MAALSEVPFKIPPDFLGVGPEGAGLVSAPEVRAPDFLRLLEETEYPFSLERRVLGGSCPAPSGACPSCPPYWMSFGAGDPWEPVTFDLGDSEAERDGQEVFGLPHLPHLSALGFSDADVAEALEMFHDCEAKAEEFLHLVALFREMGFAQGAIKEVLLVHENHRERALEELMADALTR